MQCQKERMFKDLDGKYVATERKNTRKARGNYYKSYSYSYIYLRMLSSSSLSASAASMSAVTQLISPVTKQEWSRNWEDAWNGNFQRSLEIA